MSSKQCNFGITHYITTEDERYPILVLAGDFGTIGYTVNTATGELKRVCLCSAWNADECLCGAWDDE